MSRRGGFLLQLCHSMPPPSCSGAQPDSLSIERYLHFTGGEGCLEVEVKCFRCKDVLPLLAWGLYQHLGGVCSFLSQLLFGVMQLLAHPAAHCQSRERKLGGKEPRWIRALGDVGP